MENYELVHKQLHEQLSFISQETPCPIKRSELSVPICINALEQVKKILKKQSFKTPKDEIYFFKQLKPKITSNLIFHLHVFNIEMRKPKGSSKQLKKYLSKELKKITRYTEDNIEFFQYYRSESVFLDEKYFIRGKVDLHLMLDCDYFNYDSSFNTSHDHIVAKILAFDLLTPYLCDEINKVDNTLDSDTKEITHSGLTWTDSKVHLVEFTYAVHVVGSFNRGTLELKELAKSLSELFNIEIGDIYRTWAEIKLRKEPTKYLDHLRNSLLEKIKDEFK